MNHMNLKTTDENVIILPGAKVMGQVSFGPGCSVWYNAVIRGDEASIAIGRDCNIQDNAVLHNGSTPTVLGDGITVGHSAVLHSCTIGDNTLVGMGTIVLDGAVIGKDCLIAAGSLVPPRTVIPDGSMVMGSPAKVKRALTPQEIEENRASARSYVHLKELHR